MVTDPTGGWAKAIEEASGAAKEVIGGLREFGYFLATAFRPLVGAAGDHFEIWRAERQLRLLERFQNKLRERGLHAHTRDVAPAFLLPLLARASIEADDDLQDLWATMLANAADAGSGTEPRTAFIGMLGEMTCFDVRILATLEQAAPPEEWALLETHRLPDSASVRGDAPERHIEPPRWEVEVALGNLARLGCLHPAPALGGVMNFGLVRLTRLGISFIRVCSRAPD